MLVILISIFSAVVFTFMLVPVFAKAEKSDRNMREENSYIEQRRISIKNTGYKLDMNSYYDGKEIYVKEVESTLYAHPYSLM